MWLVSSGDGHVYSANHSGQHPSDVHVGETGPESVTRTRDCCKVAQIWTSSRKKDGRISRRFGKDWMHSAGDKDTALLRLVFATIQMTGKAREEEGDLAQLVMKMKGSPRHTPKHSTGILS